MGRRKRRKQSLGQSLEDLFNVCKRKFSLKTTLMLADQMISRVEWVHSKNYVYRDIKPDNFLIGRGKDQRKIHIIDFGLSKLYKDPKTGNHAKFRDGHQLTGTARYASVNTHMGSEQSRRDDLEALGYVFMYFLRGSLPWQGVKGASLKEKYELIMARKISTPIDVLCKGHPPEFIQYLKYCKTLGYEEKPDYSYLRRLFKELMVREKEEYDSNFDWKIMRDAKEAKEREEREKR